MAVDTKKSLRNQVLYSIYVRNYSKEGTFAAVQADTGQALAADVGGRFVKCDVTQEADGRAAVAAAGDLGVGFRERARHRCDQTREP